MEFGVAMSNAKPYFLMILLQLGFAGFHIISVAILKQGMNHFVLVVYRNAVAVVAVAPFALFFERKVRPKMTLVIFLKITAQALMEVVLDQNLYYMGAKLTSASFASALIKIPAIPFIMALILRIEKLDVKRRRDQAKILGNFVTVVGALVMIFYKGPIIQFMWTEGRNHSTTVVSHDNGDWVTGTLMLLASAVCCSGFMFLQANTLKSYPAELSLSSLISFMGVVMSSAVALVVQGGDTKSWQIGWDSRLFTAVYSGIVCTGIAYYVQGIVMKERDAVFVTAFNPLCMVVVVFLGSIISAEVITLGRMLGVVIMVIGLYFFIWGKSKDRLTPSLESYDEKQTLELPRTNNNGSKITSSDLTTTVEIRPVIQNTCDNYASSAGDSCIPKDHN